MKIYLDDTRIPKDDSYVLVKDFHEFTDLVQRVPFGKIQTIQFDHDLGEAAIDEYYTNVKVNFGFDYNKVLPELTGFHCAKWLVQHHMGNNFPSFPDVYTHSSNPVGAANIQGYFNAYFKAKNIDKKCVQRELPHNIRS